MTKERQDLIDLYSDIHKDLYGFRPRGEWIVTCPISKLEAEVDRVCAELTEECRRQDQAILDDLEADRLWWLDADRAWEEAQATPEEFNRYEPLNGAGWSYTPAQE